MGQVLMESLESESTIVVYCLHFHVFMWLGYFVHVVSNIGQLIGLIFENIHGASLDGIT